MVLHIVLIKQLLTFRNAIILIKLVVNENKKDFYYNIFSATGLYEDTSNTYIFLNEKWMPVYIMNNINLIL